MGTAEAQQASFASLFDSAQVTLGQYTGKIARWKAAARMSWTIVVSVVVLGMLTAALQAVNFRRKALATALVGGFVSGATAYSAATIPADFKTLDNLVANGTLLVDAAATWLQKGRSATTDDDRRFALNEIQSRLVDLGKLRLADERASVAMPSSFTLIPVAHAAEPVPMVCGCSGAWGKQQRTAGDVIGCGTAAGASLSQAHQGAVYQAAKSIAAQIAGRVKTGLSDQQVVDYIRRSATEFDSCPAGGTKIEVSVLLRLPEFLAREEAIVAFASRSAAPAVLKVQTIGVVEDGSAGDTGWTFDIMVDGRLVTRVPARDYSDRPTTRLVSLTGRNTVEVPVELPKGNYWLVEIRGKRTTNDDTAIGGAAVSGANKPVEIAVANPIARNGSFLFTVAFAKK
jgi:hypothetical protein